MSHLSHIEVAEEFGGPGERPNMTALPDGFPSNSPVTQRNSDSMSRGHVQVGVVDTSACPNRRRYLALSRLRISDAVLFVVFRQSRESCPGQRRLRASRLLSNALKSEITPSLRGVILRHRVKMSALPLRADICGANNDVRFGPIADIAKAVTLVPLTWQWSQPSASRASAAFAACSAVNPKSARCCRWQ
jgi:hypothetical protein